MGDNLVILTSKENTFYEDPKPESLNVQVKLQKIAEQELRLPQTYRKLAKLHEKLASRKNYITITGAIKLYRSYQTALELVSRHSQLVEDTLDAVEIQISKQTPAKESLNRLSNAKIGNEIVLNVARTPEENMDLISSVEINDLSPTTVLNNNLAHGPLETSPELQSNGLNEFFPEKRNADKSSTSISMNAMMSNEKGSFPEHIMLKPGQTVAAHCKIDNEMNQEDWILAVVIRSVPASTSSSGKDEYEIEDVELGDLALDHSSGSSPLKTSSNKRVQKKTLRFIVPADKVLYIPNDEESIIRTTETIKIRQPVLALFPGTTCLYPAIVISCPSRRKKTREFLVKFADDDAPSRSVPARFIVPT